MISTKGRYAIRFLLYLTRLGEDGQAPLKDISEKEEISMKYLEKIARDLSRGGIIQGSQGKGGGYRLTVDPSSTTLWDVLSKVDEELAPVACLKCGDNVCPRKEKCPTLPMWEDYGRLTKDYFSAITLSSLSSGEFATHQ
ncbi:MAG: RrF2 family transcriptional regulator [Candidatus Ornithospirochaeta sp.]